MYYVVEPAAEQGEAGARSEDQVQLPLHWPGEVPLHAQIIPSSLSCHQTLGKFKNNNDFPYALADISRSDFVFLGGGEGLSPVHYFFFIILLFKHLWEYKSIKLKPPNL